MFRKLLLAGAIVCSSLGHAASTNGDGAARDPLGRIGVFQFSVHNIPSNVGAEGTFVMRVLVSNTTLPGEIGIPRVTSLRVTGNRANFSGIGYIVVRTNTGESRSLRGMVSVEVADNMTPITPSNMPDRITVRFLAPFATINLFFDGTVFSGDIVVTP
jgi:hypothetical protein